MTGFVHRRVAPPGGRARLSAAALVLLLLTACGPSRTGRTPTPAPADQAPFLTSPQLQKDQQAMPELGTFDPPDSPPPPDGGLEAPLGGGGAPPLGAGAVLAP